MSLDDAIKHCGCVLAYTKSNVQEHHDDALPYYISYVICVTCKNFIYNTYLNLYKF